MPEYVFRGTTINHAGSAACIAQGYTCTSWHPGVAALFGLACTLMYAAPAVVYVADVANLGEVERTNNPLNIIEREIIWGVPPQQFYNLCLGYVHLQDFRQILRQYRHPTSPNLIYGAINFHSVSNHCRGLKRITRGKIEQIVNALDPFLINV